LAVTAVETVPRAGRDAGVDFVLNVTAKAASRQAAFVV